MTATDQDNLSILDGWWIEGCIEGLTGWTRVMKGAISRSAAFFNSHRMMRRYATEAYIR